MLTDEPHKYLRLPRLRVLVLLRKATFLFVSNADIKNEMIHAGSLTEFLTDSAGMQALDLLQNTQSFPWRAACNVLTLSIMCRS